MRIMTSYKFEFCVDCYADKVLGYVTDILLKNAHSEDLEIVLKPGKPDSFSIWKDGETVSPERIKEEKNSKVDNPCCSSCC